jgi:hypothetical protein
MPIASPVGNAGAVVGFTLLVTVLLCGPMSHGAVALRDPTRTSSAEQLASGETVSEKLGGSSVSLQLRCSLLPALLAAGAGCGL